MPDNNIPDELKLENQLCFPLYACARKVVNLYEPYFKPLGITYTQYIVFLVLWEQESVYVGELSKKLYLDSGTLTPLLKKLEKEGYVERRRSEHDERMVIVSLTAKGRALQAKAADIPKQIGGCINLAPEEAYSLYTILYKIINSI
ncbi:MAG: MarR family transcriptional regulator [Clostridia bacterium]|nr:MarR family transcriptional regulator [Clostridia bacterium]